MTDTPQKTSTTKRPAVRILLGVIALTVLLVGAASAAAYFLLNEDALKSSLSRRLGREINYASLSPGLLKIHLTDFSVADTDGFAPDPLFTAENLDLSYSLLALFRGKVIFHQITIDSGSVRLEFDSQWTSNFDDLRPEEDATGIVALENLNFRNSFISLTTPGGNFSFDEVTGHISNLRSSPSAYKLRGLAAASPVEMEGLFDVQTGSWQMDLATTKLPLEEIGFLKPFLDVEGLTATVNTSIQSDSTKVAVKGRADFGSEAGFIDADLRINNDTPMSTSGYLEARTNARTLKRLPQARAVLVALDASGWVKGRVTFAGPLSSLPDRIEGEFLGVTIRVPGVSAPLKEGRGLFVLTPDLFSMDNMKFSLAGNELIAEGKIGIANPVIDLGIRSDRVDLVSMASGLGGDFVPDGATLSGSSSVDLRLEGKLAEPSINGTLGLNNVAYHSSSPPLNLTGINGPLVLEGQTVRINNISATLDGTQLTADGTYNRAASSFDVAIDAPNADLSALANALGAPISISGTAALSARLTGSPGEPTMTGRINSSGMSLNNVPFNSFDARVSYTGDQLKVTSANAKLLGGSLDGTATVFVGKSPLHYEANISGAALQLSSFFDELLGYKNISGGLLSGQLDIKGNGTTVEAIFGRGALAVNSADLRNVAAFQELAPFLGLSPDALNIFRTARATFRIENGDILLTKPVTLEAGGVQIEANGRIGLDGTLALTANALVPQSSLIGAIGGTAIGSIIGAKSSNGRVSIPFAASGTFRSPKFHLNINPQGIIDRIAGDRLGDIVKETTGADTSAGSVIETAEDILRDRAGKQLKEALEKAAPAPAPPTDQADTTAPQKPPSTEETVRGVLDRILRPR